MCHQKEWSIRRSVDRTVSIASFVISCHATPHAQMLKLWLTFDWLLQHLGCWWDRYANGMVHWTGLLPVLCNSLSSKIFSNIMVLACLWSRSRFGSDWRMQRLHGLKSMKWPTIADNRNLNNWQDFSKSKLSNLPLWQYLQSRSTSTDVATRLIS